MLPRFIIGLGLLLWQLAGSGLAHAQAQAGDDLVAAGRAIYLLGRLPGGGALQGTRYGTAVRGAAAACVTCHRRSGMGSVEGDQLISPVTGNALFQARGRVVATMDPVRGKLLNQGHEPFSEDDFSRVVREGTHPSGRMLNELMPRFALGEPELRALSAYLRTLSTEPSPGAEDNLVRLATIVAPDVSEERRKAFLDTLQAAVSQKNGSTMPGKRHMVMAAEFTMKTERHWDLQVWQLSGPPETWRAQLQQFYQASPVFAVLSGLSDGTWAPVHQFCEDTQLPCWFPVVEAPPVEASQSFYSIYFSRGVLLEADVLARQLKQMDRAHRPARVVQVVGAGVAGSVAADQLKKALQNSGIKLETRPLGGRVQADVLKRALAGLGPRDAAVLWLRPDEIQALETVKHPVATTYFSGELGGGERMPLPADWKPSAQLLYPYELPQKRGANLAYFKTWINQRNIKLIDEPLQNKAYFAVSYLSETIAEMLNNLYRDYLIERAENMLSLRESRKAETETHERQTIRQRYTHIIEAGHTGGAAANVAKSANGAVITPAENLGQRTGTTVYPPLGLGIGQRFASKGAYIVKFGEDADPGLVAESDWTVP